MNFTYYKIFVKVGPHEKSMARLLASSDRGHSFCSNAILFLKKQLLCGVIGNSAFYQVVDPFSAVPGNTCNVSSPPGWVVLLLPLT